MRIGIDYTSAVRQGGGIGRYTRNLIAALALLDHDSDYVLFSAGKGGRVDWPANFRRRSLPLTDRQLAIMWQRLRLPVPIELFLGKLDLFHSPDFVLPPVRRACTALTVHDLSFMRCPECFSEPLLDYLNASVPRSVAGADAILADSESTRTDLIELLHVPADRVRVVYAGVEERFVPRPVDADLKARLARYGIQRPYILGVGTLQPRKNFPGLIRAFDRLRRSHDVPHQLVIVGARGWLHEEIDATIAELRLEEQVCLTHFVSDEDLPAVYAGADVFAFPSLYEGFGIPILEAMGCGVPVVTADVSSLPEVAGDAALLVDPHDGDALAEALWRLIDDTALRQTLREKGMLQVERFRWQQSAQALLSVYHDLIG